MGEDEARAPISVLSRIWDNDHVAYGPLNSHTYTIHVVDEGGELVQELQVTRGELRAIAQRGSVPVKDDRFNANDAKAARDELELAFSVDGPNWRITSLNREMALQAYLSLCAVMDGLLRASDEDCSEAVFWRRRYDEAKDECLSASAQRDKALEERDEARLRVAYCEGRLSRAGLRTLGEAIDLRAFDRVPWESMLGKAVSLGFDPANTITSRPQLVQFILEKVEANPSAPSIQDWIDQEEAKGSEDA